MGRQYDAPGAYDQPGKEYDGCATTGPSDWYPGPLLTAAPVDDDGDELLLMVATLRSRLRL